MSSFLWRLTAAFASATSTALAFPHWNLWPVAWFGLVPFLWALGPCGPRRSVLMGWLAGSLHYAVLVYWLLGTIQTYGGLPLLLALPVHLLLVLYLGAFWGLFGGLLSYLRGRTGLPFMVLAPPLWCALEWVRGHLLTGFPWGLLGYSQWAQVPLIQISDLTGVYGVSFLLMASNAALTDLLGACWNPAPGTIRRAFVAVLTAAFLVGASLIYGVHAIKRTEALCLTAPPLTVGIAQGNIEQTLKWDPAYQEATLQIYEELTERLSAKGARIVVWPETAAPFFFQIEDAWNTRIRRMARSKGVELLFGSPAFGIRGNGQRTYYNRAYLLGPDGEVRGSYDKVHLVPFGEYVPLRRVLFFVRRMVESVGDFSPGAESRPLPSSSGASIGVLICFESIFPELTRDLIRNGADVLANLTNDAWFGDTAAPRQHLTMLLFRAVEARRWIVRSANTGISAVMDPCGRIRRALPFFHREGVVDTIRRLSIESFYTRWGDFFVYACSLWTSGLIILGCSAARVRKRLLKQHSNGRGGG